MQSALVAKEALKSDTPLLFFDVELSNGMLLHWCTRTITCRGFQYEARVVKNSLFEAQLASDTGIGGTPKLSFDLANADSAMSQIENQAGFKGAQLTVTLAFVDVTTGFVTSDSYLVFRGLLNSPESISESLLRLSGMNRMTMQRAVMPEVRIQRMCPWRFPSNAAQRVEAVDGGIRGKYSPLYRCGYSADLPEGTGNLNGAEPFVSCSNTRADCEQRGMFNKDSKNRQTGRFGGFEFVPASILVRGNGQSSSQISAVRDNQARYNDFVPLIYGTQWHAPDVVFSRNDGNLTRMEVLLSMGSIEGVLQVLVNGVEIPRGQSGRDMTATGWYNVINWGSRNGIQNGDFADSAGTPIGDPYGNMAYLSVVVPNRVNNGTSLPKVQALVQGLKLYIFDTDGNYQNELFSDNPAWVLLDILMRSGWTLEELDKGSFARAAAYAAELITVDDPVGGTIQMPRFQCNFALKDRRSAGEVIRSIRSSSRLYLVQNAAGLLEVRVENSFALQQPSRPAGSNALETFDGGWPAYEFDESSIARKSDGSSSVALSCKGAQDSPNRFSIEFQDRLNQFQQDSLSLGDGDDADLCGHEVAINLDAVGISTFNQAARMLLLAMNRSIEGNRYISFESSVKALGLSPGDLITVSYRKEGLLRMPFRVTKVAPGAGFRSSVISAQIHEDVWFSDSTDVLAGAVGRQPGQSTGLPQPVMGTVLDANGELQLAITELESTGTDGSAAVTLGIGFVTPNSSVGTLAAPLMGFVPVIATSGGNLAGPRALFYSVSAVDAQGAEGSRSFLAQALLDQGPTNSVTLKEIQLPKGAVAFHVYRGSDPRLGLRIASNVAPDNSGTTSFLDIGLPAQSILPPDPLADHYNVYWRWETVPESNATAHTLNTISHAELEMADNTLTGMRVRITRGTGVHQERTVIANTADTLTVDLPWRVEPDATSFFVVAESAWKFGCSGVTSPISFDVPERIGSGVHVLLRTAATDDAESPQDISPMTRWVLGQSESLSADSAVPPGPLFATSVNGRRAGTLELSGIAFPTFANTRGITSGTFRLHYFDELDGVTFNLDGDMTSSGGSLALPSDVTPGTAVQIGREVLSVGEANGDGTYTVSRGVMNTSAAAHSSASKCFLLQQKAVVVPFVKSFFGSPASGTWSYAVDFPSIRLAAAELTVTNAFGNSPTAINAYTALADFGLRTLSGGQYCFQVSGYLAIQTGAAPDIVVDKDRSIASIYATLRTPPNGSQLSLQLNVNGSVFGALIFSNGETTSTVLDGLDLAAFRAGDRISLDVTSVGASNPGSDLTVMIWL